MRVRCERSSLSAEQVRALGMGFPDLLKVRANFAVDPGQEYDVAGVYVKSGIVWLNLIEPDQRVVSAPGQLFVITDGNIPRSWTISKDADSEVVYIAPIDASDIFFADRVDRSEDRAIAALRRILAELGRIVGLLL